MYTKDMHCNFLMHILRITGICIYMTGVVTILMKLKSVHSHSNIASNSYRASLNYDYIIFHDYKYA